MNSEFSDQAQRYAVCVRQYESKRAKAAYIIKASDDEILYTKSTVYLPAALVEKLKSLPESGPGYHKVRAKYKSGKTYAGMVHNCAEFETDDDEIEEEDDEMMDVEMDDVSESYAAKNEGKTLNKPFRLPKGSSKKFGVYVKNDKGNIVVVKFGDPNLSIKRDDPERRSNFRARHGCDNPGPKWKAKYWACKFWSKKPVSELASSEDIDWDNLPEQTVDASVPIEEESDI